MHTNTAKMLGFLTLLLNVQTLAADDPPMRFFIENRSLLADIEEKLEQVRKECSSASNNLVGEYTGDAGTDTYSSLFVAPTAGVVYLEHGNFGILDGNCGEAVVEKDVITCEFKHMDGANTQRTLSGDLSQLIVVRWGGSPVLVPLSRLHGFCVRMRDPAERPYLIKQVYRKSDLEPDGNVVLPEKLEYLLELPELEARILRVRKTDVQNKPDFCELVRQSVELSCGTDDKVFVGMEFTFNDILNLRIVSCGRESSTALMHEIVYKGQKAPKRLKVGMVVRTAKY